MTVYRYKATVTPTTVSEMLGVIELSSAPNTNISVTLAQPGFVDLDLTNPAPNSKADLDAYMGSLGFEPGQEVTDPPARGQTLATSGAGWSLVPNTVYDCVVPDDHALPSAAFGAGCTSVFVRKGTYIEQDNVDVPSNGLLHGEPGSILDLVGGYSVRMGNQDRLETAGTVSITAGNADVSGSGTVFSNLQVGDFILLGGSYFQIAAIADDLNLQINQLYRGEDISSQPMIGQSMDTQCQIRGVTLTRAPNSALVLNQVLQASLLDVEVRESGSSTEAGIQVTRSGEVILDGDRVSGCVTDGVRFSGSNGGEVSESLISNCGRDGVLIDGSQGIRLDLQSRGHGRHGILVASTSGPAVISHCILAENRGAGVILGADSVAVGCVVHGNGDGGIRTGGNSGCSVTGNRVFENGGVGIAVEPGSEDCLVAANRVGSSSISDYVDGGSGTRSGLIQTIQSGRNGTTNPGQYYRAINGMSLNDSNRGIPCKKGTLRTVTWTREDIDSASLEVLVNGLVVAVVQSNSSGPTSATPNVAIDAGLMSFRNLATGNPTSNVQITAEVETEPAG